MPRSQIYAFGICLLLSGALVGPSAFAGDAVAQKLFDDAKSLMAAKNFAEACPKLEQSQHIEPSEGTVFALGYCHENNGQLVSAWLDYKEGLASAKKSGNGQRVELAKQRIALLEPRLSTLTVIGPAGTPGAAVTLDGRPFVAGSAVPVDGGSHVVSVTAEGKQPFETKVDVATEKDQKTVSVPALMEAPLVAPPVVNRSEAKSTPTMAYVLVGTGALFTAGAIVSQLIASAAHDERRSDCVSQLATACDDTGKSKVRTWEGVSLVSGGLALASFGSAIYLFVSAPTKESTAATQAYLRVVPQVGGLQVEGAF